MTNTVIMQLIFNLLLFIMWMVFCNIMLERRFSLPVTLLVWVMCYCACYLLKHRSDTGSAARMLLGMAVILLVAFALYKSRLSRVLFAVFASQALMVLSEYILLLIFPDVMWAMGSGEALARGELYRGVTVCVISTLLNGLFLLGAVLLFSRYKNRLSAGEWLLYGVFLLSQTVMLGSWLYISMYGNDERSLLWLAADIVVFLAADAALYFAMRGMAQRTSLRAENALLEKQIDAQTEHYTALTEQYENVRRMRHDIANHVHTIQILLSEGRTGEAAAYASELLPQTDYTPGLGRCENPVVDAFLYSRIRELREQGVDVTEDVALPVRLHIANTDLITAFGNLLDNAAEACRKAEDARLTVQAGIEKGYLVIRTENPLPDSESAAKKRRIPELERGVGFNTLQRLAQRCGGSFTYSDSDGVFRTELILKEGAYDAAHSGL